MSQDTWKDLKSKVEGLGLKLKLHLEQEEDETNTEAKPGDTKAAVEDLGNKVQDAFASFGSAAKDQAVREDVKDIGQMLKDTMLETFSNVGAEVGDRIQKVRGEDAEDAATASTDSPSEADPAS